VTRWRSSGVGALAAPAIVGARLAGATTIIAIDLDPRKLDQGESSGPPMLLMPRVRTSSSGSPLTDGNGANVCIEAVGSSKVMEQAFYARDLAGILVQVGVPTPRCALTWR